MFCIVGGTDAVLTEEQLGIESSYHSITITSSISISISICVGMIIDFHRLVQWESVLQTASVSA